ncbi:hypothetical protein DBR11_18560 [Pedobacter sp. HMWF019]|uniref:hypothetical protein n=1 Tax=Pedobacter sp. HMWF019 TaxID=2056856 RepID=UPI000D38B3C6|nr:hypothetical protein [Pedobacter sp. HMWF019]PTS96776.1 hypothetical protein DBR11_18560 [Pedobacter sp. HMWF019]
MKTADEIKKELDRLESIVAHAEGECIQDCSVLEPRILTLRWVLNLEDKDGNEINIEEVDGY